MSFNQGRPPGQLRILPSPSPGKLKQSWRLNARDTPPATHSTFLNPRNNRATLYPLSIRNLRFCHTKQKTMRYNKIGAMKYDRIRTLQSINARKSRSAWGRAVNEYAYELAESIEDGKEFKDINSFAIELLNGACDWCEYSEGGCSLISDYEIAERLCPPSKFKKKKYGELPPYRGMSWIALQGRALCAASYVVKSHLKIKKHESEI